jgi:HEAT repeat protein
MAQVFVSYKSEERKFALQVKERIEGFGYGVWIDNENLRAGEDWRADIDLGIDTSFALVVIISKNVLQSKYMIYEFAYAMALRIHVIPVIYDEGITASDFHPRFEGVQHISFVKADEIEEGFIKLRKELERTGKTENLMVVASKYPKFIQNILEKFDDSSDAHERKQILNQLVENEHPDVNEFLAELSSGYIWRDIPSLAARRLAERTQYEDTRAIQGLIHGLLNGIDRENCTKYLMGYGSSAVEQILPVLDSDNRQAKRHIIEILGELRIKTAISLIIKLAKEEDCLRESAIMALGKMESEEAVPLLLDFMDRYLSGEDTSVRLSLVIETLGLLKNNQAVKPLINILNDMGLTSFWNNAGQALIRINDIEFDDIKILFEHDDDMVKANGAKLMSYVPNWDTLDYLEKCLTSNNDDMKFESAKVLGEIGSEKSIALLLEHLDDKDINELVLYYIGDYKPRQAVDKLHEILTNLNLSDISNLQLNTFAKIEPS